MTKILKKVQLCTEQSTLKNADPTKGTQTNPYTQKEMAILQEEGAWNGGYVEGMGYMAPMMSMLDSSGSYPKRIIKIKGGKKNSQTVKIDNFDEFSVYLKFSWESGDAAVVPITHPHQMPDSPITVTAYNKRFVYEIKTNTILFMPVDRCIPPSSLVEIGNNYFKVDMTFHYKKTVYDLETHEKKVFEDIISRNTYEVDITDDLYWEYYNV